jgi:hypothetical protein
MSLPHATQAQINEMNAIAEKKMKEDGIAIPPLPEQVVENKHPMLAHHEEPSTQFEQEQVELPEEVEEEDIEQEETVEDVKKINYRMMRESLDRANRERDEAMKYAMSFQQQQQPKQTQQVEQEDDYSDIGLDDDGLAEGKHLKKVLKEMRELKKEMQAYKAKSTQDTVEVRLKTTFPDFDKVITQDNLATLSNLNPDLADMISNTPDMYKRAKLAYDMVKQYGIYKEESFVHEKAAAQRNAAKPRPLASVSPQQGDSPLSKANAFANGALSKEIKDQMHREMLQAMKGR